MLREEFYEECARILGCEYEGEAFTSYKRTRWNNRRAGQGRFPGFGTIRHYGDDIHVALRHPITSIGTFKTEEEVISFLEKIIASGS